MEMQTAVTLLVQISIALTCIVTMCMADIIAEPDEIVRMANQEGYTIERHTISTSDDYFLGLYRMPANRTATTPNVGPPAVVLLMHGLFASAADYLVLGRDYGLAYVLADAGFDVWLGNSRGTSFSRAHRQLDPDTDAAFWDYSFHEIGTHDLPAMIDYIQTQHPSTANDSTTATSTPPPIHYVAHSQGCTAMFVLLSQRPEYSQRIRTLNLMAPAVYMSESHAVDDRIIRLLDRLSELSRRLNVYELSPLMPVVQRLSGVFATMCPPGSMLQMLCVNVYFSTFAGSLPQPLTKRQSRNIYENSLNGVSVKQLVHFGQLIDSHRFRQFDYGEVANRRVYGGNNGTDGVVEVGPPEYSIAGRANVSMQIFYGTADTIVAPKDVQHLIDVCDPFVESAFPSLDANHFDFVLSKDAHEKYYGKVIRMIRKHA